MKRVLISTILAVSAAFAMSATTYAADFVRPMPSKPIQLGPTVLGSERPVVCATLVGNDLDTIKKEAATVKELKPDMVEVRADYWDFIEDTDKAMEALKEVRKIIGDTPILLTVRRAEERGAKPIDEQKKFDFYKRAADEKLPNLIDIELALGKDKIENFKKSINGSIPIVVAHHDLKATPAKEEIVAIMEKEVDSGADVAKIVVNPNSQEDVLTFLSGTLDFRNKHPEYPIIASASGNAGRITRLAGGLFGIDLTFASGVKGSNPWQMPVGTVKEINEVIYPLSK